jgi:hypothetical protein
MTTLTMRMIKGDFVVTGPDVEPMKFKTRREAREWCTKHHPGSPIEEIGRGGKGAAAAAPNRAGRLSDTWQAGPVSGVRGNGEGGRRSRVLVDRHQASGDAAMIAKPRSNEPRRY